MPDCSEHKNPLQRSGTSQGQRHLPGLRDDYVHIDERQFDDWIIFAKEFSRFIKYFDAGNAEAGNWEPFFSNDISALLGAVAVQRVETYQQLVRESFDFIKKEDNKSAPGDIKRKLSLLFSAILTLAKAMDSYLLKTAAYNYSVKLSGQAGQQVSLHTTIQGLVKSKLAPALKRLMAYYKAASSATYDYILPAEDDYKAILTYPFSNASAILSGDGLSSDWWIFPSSVSEADKNWQNYFNSVAADDSIFQTPALTGSPDETLAENIYTRVSHAARHNLFTSVFDQFLMGYSRIVQEAEKELLKTLGEWDSHPPHYALFLAFLKLFRFAQSHINDVKRKHLDYYYREILQLFPKEALPTHAHILAELAKHSDNYLISKGTLFKAGKDSEGKEVLYAADYNETLNKASVAAFKSVYFGTAEDSHKIGPPPSVAVANNEGRLFASSVANSADGLGAELTTVNKEWHPFVNRVYKEARLADIAMPNTEIGFVLASHYLSLAEGRRKVSVKLFADDNVSLTLAAADINCYLTAEKEWFRVLSFAVTSGTISTGEGYSEITFTLTGDAPAIVNYNSKVHGGTIDAALPMLKVTLKNEDGLAYQYNLVRNISITKAEITVEAGSPGSTASQDGLKQLLLSNDFGPLDASKPFSPFGAQPQKDATLVIGNKEAFCKKNAFISLNLKWANLPDVPESVDYDKDSLPIITELELDNGSKAMAKAIPAELGGITFVPGRFADPPYAPHVSIRFLAGSSWVANASAPSSAAIITGGSSSPDVKMFPTGLSVPANAVCEYNDTYEPYNAASRKGFLRLALTGSFGHKEYLADLTNYLLLKAKDPESTEAAPPEPYSPLLQSINLSYTAYDNTELNSTDKNIFEKRSIRFYHLYPFGEAEQHACIAKKNNPEKQSFTIKLFPQFEHEGANKQIQNSAAEFYIGLKDMKAQQSVSLLFQVLDGSADPLVNKPDDHVRWSYLSNNEWRPFLTQDIADGTAQLIQPGIIRFKIPADAAVINSVLPAGFLWLRACVHDYAMAVCALLNVHAQATVVTFSPNDNADDFLNNALPGGSITKLKTPASAVKKIEQPYSSFGGRKKEADDAYYVRVSERLRHKARAITIWDYEHMVLEAFPQIHKVKCLNHTKLSSVPGSSVIEYNEAKPGHVTIITIPGLLNRNDINPLKPFTSQGLIKQIKEYLQKKISCHVKLEVANPQFEEVRLSFALKLAEGFTDFTFYREKLQHEITAFLTPWAYSDKAEVQFGGKIYKSVLINFIEEREYVGAVTDVQLFHRKNETTPETGDLDEVEASQARSVLVSAQAKLHNIIELVESNTQATQECAAQTGMIN